MARLGPAFKKEAAKVIEKLQAADPKEVARSLAKNGYYNAGGYKLRLTKWNYQCNVLSFAGKRFHTACCGTKFRL